jgi:hypothetical protein
MDVESIMLRKKIQNVRLHIIRFHLHKTINMEFRAVAAKGQTE